jgi:hypothetical protein
MLQYLHRTFHMTAEGAFKAVFWTLLVLMFLMRFRSGLRRWRTYERIRSERDANQREGLCAHVVGGKKRRKSFYFKTPDPLFAGPSAVSTEVPRRQGVGPERPQGADIIAECPVVTQERCSSPAGITLCRDHHVPRSWHGIPKQS